MVEYIDKLVDPELASLLKASAMPLPLSTENLPNIRDALVGYSLVPPTADGLQVDKTEIFIRRQIGAPPIRVLIYRPPGDHHKLPAFLHIHGGGYVVGTPEIAEEINRRRALLVECVVVSVEYRLAPEWPHPAPLEDCYTALKWIHSNAEQLNINPHKIAVGGESAGGGLAAALALLARDRDEVPIAFQYLIYPMLDDRTTTNKDFYPFVAHAAWSAEQNRFAWSALLGEAPGGLDVSMYAAPSRAIDLSKLPPAFISVGALDLFLEEDLEYARRLLKFGVPVELHVYPGAFHGFDYSPTADVSKFANDIGIRALSRALGGLIPDGAP